MRRRSTCVFAIAILVAIVFLSLSLLIAIAYCNSNELLRLFLLNSLQYKAVKGAIRSSGALVSLDDASISFGCKDETRRGDVGGNRNLGADDKIISGGCWNLELRHLHIGNARNNDGTKKDWSSPYAVHLNELRLSVSGHLAFLSLLQLTIATSIFDSPSLPRSFCNGLDFVIGFRIRSIDVLEINGLTVYIEEGEEPHLQEEEGEKTTRHSEAVIKRGLLTKLKGSKRQRNFIFILEPSLLSWFEPKEHQNGLPGDGMMVGVPMGDQQLQKQDQGTDNDDLREIAGNAATQSSSSLGLGKARRNKSRGSLRLFASSSVEIIDDQSLDLELISDTEYLVLRSPSLHERDAWFDAISGAIVELQPHTNSGGGRSNAPWIEELAAEANARKVRWRRWERRRRYEWQQRWQSNGSSGHIDDHGGRKNVDESNDDDYARASGGNSNDDDVNMDDDDEDEGGSKDFLEGIRNLHSTLEGRHLNTKHGKRFEDALEWRIGRLSMQKGLDLHINEQHWSLDENGWTLNGFVGSSSELRRRLHFDLGPKLLKDSSGRVIMSGITGFTGKEGYVFGDLTKATVAKIGEGVVDAVQDFTGKEQYEFGDLTKTAVNKIGDGVADAVQGFTGKENYVFGDLTKTAVNKIGDGVTDAVQGFTGKEQYEFGDLTKTAVNKIGAEVADVVHDFTGKEQYKFGDLTRTMLSKLRPSRSKGGQIKLDGRNNKREEEL